MKILTGHQIDVIRRAILTLSEMGEQVPLVELAAYLLSQNKSGFHKNDWCGYKKFRPMIEGYPEFFEIFGEEKTNMAVRVVNHSKSKDTYRQSSRMDMNFDTFVRDNLTKEAVADYVNEFKLKDGLEDFCVFCNVLRYTYHKANTEGKVLALDDLRLVHTGWFYENVDPIFILWGYDPENNPWISLERRSTSGSRGLIRLFGDMVPELISFPRTEFNMEWNIETEFGHILDERGERIPDDIIDLLRNYSTAINPRILSKNEVIEERKNFLRILLLGCIEDTRHRLRNRTEEAVQFWDRRRDKMCWLIPLRMGIDDRVNLALVLEPSELNNTPVYRAHTILGLKDAFKCARLLGPVRADWLKEAWKL